MLYHGDCREVMAQLDAESVDAIVTDPPYDLTTGKKGGTGQASVDLDSPYGRSRITAGNSGGFMGKSWDATGVAHDPETWVAALRVLKPGGHLVAFGGARTFHRLTCAIEDAGFEIRDCLSWLYGSGFPKSLNVSKAMDREAGAKREVVGRRTDGPSSWLIEQKREHRASGGTGIGYADGSGKEYDITTPATDLAKQWDGWGTALKPAWEPIILARKPLIGTVSRNVEHHGTGALNIDGCRIETQEALGRNNHVNPFGSERTWSVSNSPGLDSTNREGGRWPANVVLDEEAAALLDASVPASKGGFVRNRTQGARPFNNNGAPTGYETTARIDEPDGGPSRFFYCAKASRAERNAGLEGMEERVGGCLEGNADTENARKIGARPDLPVARTANHHPTVKPVALMRWLVRLITPPGGMVLDPFMGSGTTGIACALEGMAFTGIEQDAEYLEIARRRIAHAQGPLFAET
jgi:DNA modification methylase